MEYAKLPTAAKIMNASRSKAGRFAFHWFPTFRLASMARPGGVLKQGKAR
jgi:hypothetical protein